MYIHITRSTPLLESSSRDTLSTIFAFLEAFPSPVDMLHGLLTLSVWWSLLAVSVARGIPCSSTPRHMIPGTRYKRIIWLRTYSGTVPGFPRPDISNLLVLGKSQRSYLVNYTNSNKKQAKIYALFHRYGDQRFRETVFSPTDRQHQGNSLTDSLGSKKQGRRSKNPRLLKNAWLYYWKVCFVQNKTKNALFFAKTKQNCV